MGILEKMNKKHEQHEQKAQEENVVQQGTPVKIDFSMDELEFLIRMIGDTNFKGNDLMFIYELVNKLQNLYLDKKGVQ